MIGMIFLGFVLSFSTFLPQRVEGCHFTKIKYENGTWCCPDVEFSDTVSNITFPPIPTGTTESTEATAPPIIPSGDCVCGLGVDLIKENFEEEEEGSSRISNADNAKAKKIIRPWLVKILVEKDSRDIIQCTGSILNRRWIITAAHCFCGVLIPCGTDKEGFEKEIKVKMERIKMWFGTPATEEKVRGPMDATRVLVHPDYFQGPHRAPQPVDVALIETKSDLELQKIENANDKITGLVPICLPPDPNVHPEEIFPTEEEKKNETGKANRTKNTFEDMDCWLTNTADMLGNTQGFDPDQGYLKCNPKAFTDPFDVHIASSTSFITAFGSTSRESGRHGYKELRYLCRTNAYGPRDSLFHDCYGKCHKDVEAPILVDGKQTKASNPSLADPVCKKFLEKVAKSGMMDKDFKKMTEKKSMRGIDPSKVEIFDDDDNLHTCYPFDEFKKTENIRSGFEYPFRHGWCSVCERKGVNSSMKCDSLLKEDSNWGWCLPECDEDFKQPEGHEYHEYPHEVAVDAFVYENCSNGIDTFKEFCTGAKLATAYTLRYMMSGGDFELVDGVHRHFSPGDPDWSNNPSIVRPGSRYQGLQHTQVSGDVCYGDAGGSVWKLWSFRHRNKDDYTRPKQGKLAVLTGIISRFEQHCGFFRPDQNEHWWRPVQHSIHARVTSIRNWIIGYIKTSGSCVGVNSKERFLPMN